MNRVVFLSMVKKIPASQGSLHFGPSEEANPSLKKEQHRLRNNLPQ
jgi:hypothetical protein